MKNAFKIYTLYFVSILLAGGVIGQKNMFSDSLPSFTYKSAGPQYQRSSFHQILWGHNYRKEWSTPVKVSTMLLDTAKGELIPYKKGGGHQSMSLHLRNLQGKEYVLRSVNKNVSKLVPPVYQGTFIEDIVQDEISMSHPYGAITIPYMAETSGIYHTNPQYVYLPHQTSLGTFNNTYGDALYLFEQKIDGDWKEADNLGNFKKYISTDDLVKKMLEDNDEQVDEYAFARARLFDMFIGDWDRHEGQWKWGENDTKKHQPIPQDRDQAFFKYNGILSKAIVSATGTNYLQSFQKNLKNVKTFNYEARNLDRFFTNQLTLQEWQSIAKQLQQSLTDTVIEKSVKQLPADIFAISGSDIIEKLKQRREHLVEWATEYYLFLAKEVEIPGSKKREHFEIKQLDSKSTLVNIYSIDNEGKQNSKPYYTRVFNSNETKEIRLFGINGKDKYTLNGNQDNRTKVKIIGGTDKDSILENSHVRKLSVYDDANNSFGVDKFARMHLSDDTSVHSFKYGWFAYEKKGLKPSVFFSYEDRLYVGLGYSVTHHSWRKEPFASKQLLDLHYSLMQKAFSVTYTSLFPKVIGKGDLSFFANYDAIRWTNFFGLGNETKFIGNNINYYRMRTEEWLFSPTIIYKSGNNRIDISPFFQSRRIFNDNDRFVSKTFASFDHDLFDIHLYAGAQVQYTFTNVNDSILATKGVIFSTGVLASKNLKEDKAVGKVFGNVQFLIPLVSKLSLSIKVGGATLAGNPEFYEYASIGGPNLRGLIRDRYWGKSVFYNMNDVRFITDAKTHFYNGKAGVLVFIDNGRVWMPNEKSNEWHTGYGAGFILAPFNKISGEITYGFSPDGSILQVRIYKYF